MEPKGIQHIYSRICLMVIYVPPTMSTIEPRMVIIF
jgi:hypothetical protein